MSLYTTDFHPPHTHKNLTACSRLFYANSFIRFPPLLVANSQQHLDPFVLDKHRLES